MDNTKDDKYYIQRIKKDLEFIVVHMQNVDIEELNKNEVLLDSMLFRMIQVSENAKKLFKSDKYSVNEVCEMCGFDNLSYFSKTFKKFTNQTPSEYKKLVSNEKKHQS